jgi:hypothetical protein
VVADIEARPGWSVRQPIVREREEAFRAAERYPERIALKTPPKGVG